MRKTPAVLVIVAAVACDKDEPRPAPPAPAPVASVEKLLGIDAGELDPGADPPAPAGDFAADMAAFTTVDACTQQHAAMDPLVGDALQAIGYATMVRDACRVLDAAKAGDAKRCAGIDASPLRERCVAVVAEITGNPDACPFELATRPERGRDAACVALAARDARLCAGALDAAARATCAAIATHDAAPCGKLGARGDQARCARDAKRWTAAIPASTAGSGAAPAASGGTAAAGGAALAASATATAGDVAVPLDVARGVVLVERIDGAHVVVGPMGRAGAGFPLASPLSQASLAVELVVPVDVKRAGVERLELALPQQPPIAVESPRTASLTVRVTRFERARGGAVELAVEGRPEGGPPLKMTAVTFVRDVVTARAMLGPARFGDGGFLR